MLINEVDVFHGNLEYELPEPEGVAAKWFFLKAQTGNTHPGALLPFDPVAAGAYTGGYPTGSTPYWYNTHSRPERIMDPQKPLALGFSHFRHSGTGAVGFYYNYFILTPVAGNNCPEKLAYFPLKDEEGSPGVYRCKLGDIPAKIAAGPMSCCYEFVFPPSGGMVICDPALNGLIRDKKCESPQGKVLDMKIGSDNLEAQIQYDFSLSVFLSAPRSKEIRRLDDGRVMIRFSGGPARLYLGFSFNGADRARKNGEAAARRGMEDLIAGSASRWEDLLAAVDIDSSGGDRKLFYSCLYHSLAKPDDITGDSPFWNPASSWVDIVTMWDGYKAQYPLLCTLYGKESSSLVSSMINSAKHFGYFPNCLCLVEPNTDTDMQARCLSWYTIFDAYKRGIRGVDYKLALELMEGDLNRPVNRDFLERGLTTPYASHTWDISSGCYAAGLLAKDLAPASKAEQFFKYAENWVNALDPATGLIPAGGKFYEGNHWNYSFRLLPQMSHRMGNKEDFVKKLDTFFGYGAERVIQNLDPRNSAAMRAGENLGRFEGFNNETDMEAPYAYIYAGRQDRTAEICRLGMRSMFAPGPGGLCGNDDSGGLCGMYLCNTLGLFPASGLPYLFIGSPGIGESRLHLHNGNSFSVRCSNYSNGNLYVKSARLNGKILHRAWLLAEELMAGGELDLEMSPNPEAWDTEGPPSF
ncbi:hypothetical protein FACS1894163_08020 [Spirochaetia bacterium]|nr:hypothetical protein FACS1894163_08020 [Spirochaetia bacterium]